MMEAYLCDYNSLCSFHSSCDQGQIRIAVFYRVTTRQKCSPGGLLLRKDLKNFDVQR